MKIDNLTTFASLVLGSLVSNTKQSELSATLTYNDARNFTSKGYWFIKFCAPWSPRCKHLEPIWKDISTKSHGWALNNDFHFAKVNCNKQGRLCEEFNITGYPTLNLFKNGVHQKECLGTNNLEDILSCMSDIPEKFNLPPIQFNPAIDFEKTASLEKVTRTKDTVAVNFNFDNFKKDKKKQDTMFNESIISLDHNNFNSTLNGKWFIHFYAPWCSHSKKLIPKWNILSNLAKDEFNVAKVNCDIEEELCKSLGIMKFPTLIYFKNGTMIEYSGKRNVKDFYSFIINTDKESILQGYVHEMSHFKFLSFYSVLVLFLFFAIIQILRRSIFNQPDSNNGQTCLETEIISKSQVPVSEKGSIVEHRIIVDLKRNDCSNK